jgi:hypothetical protein
MHLVFVPEHDTFNYDCETFNTKMTRPYDFTTVMDWLINGLRASAKNKCAIMLTEIMSVLGWFISILKKVVR